MKQQSSKLWYNFGYTEGRSKCVLRLVFWQRASREAPAFCRKLGGQKDERNRPFRILSSINAETSRENVYLCS